MKQRSSCRRPLGLVGLVVGTVLAATGAVSTHAEEAASSDPGRFALEINACPTLRTESVRRILSIEIGDLLLPEAYGVSAETDRLIIRCVGSFAWVRAVGPVGTAPVEQIMGLDDFPGDAAPRALALAGLELLATLSSSVRVRMASKYQATPPVVAPVAATPEPTPAASMTEARVGVAGTWRRFLARDGASVWGGQVRAGSTVSRLWQLAADAEVAGGRNQVGGIGETSAVLLSCGASVGLHGRSGMVRTRIGLGGRFGFVRLSGTSADPATTTAATVWHPWGGPMATAAVSARSGRFTLDLSAEVGQSMLQSTGLAGDTSAIAVRGSWIAIILGGELHR